MEPVKATTNYELKYQSKTWACAFLRSVIKCLFII